MPPRPLVINRTTSSKSALSYSPAIHVGSGGLAYAAGISASARHDEEETQNASAHHVLKIISRSPWAARSFTSVGSLHYVAATLGVVARSLGAPHAGAESAGPRRAAP